MNLKQSKDEKPVKKRRREDLAQKTKVVVALEAAITSILASSSDDEERASTKSAEEITDRYHKEKRISAISEDSLQWWNTNEKEYPDLAKLDCQYLCCPPSSVPRE